ncbi:MAG: PspC domain-containing protein [Spirochaetales bacterium]|nr:PspC domain-containing protein [Spirochaetales bacterium]
MRAFRSNRLYRARGGAVFGVCLGFARWRELPVGMVRLIYLGLTIFTGFVPMLLLYIALAVFLPIDRSDGYRDPYRDPPGDDPRDSYRRDRERDWDRKFYD